MDDHISWSPPNFHSVSWSLGRSLFLGGDSIFESKTHKSPGGGEGKARTEFLRIRFFEKDPDRILGLAMPCATRTRSIFPQA
jgi:hypothetical protein